MLSSIEVTKDIYFMLSHIEVADSRMNEISVRQQSGHVTLLVYFIFNYASTL